MAKEAAPGPAGYGGGPGMRFWVISVSHMSQLHCFRPVLHVLHHLFFTLGDDKYW